jgi:hypothetical protein
MDRIFGDDRSDDGGFACSYLSHNVYEISGKDVHTEVIYYGCFSVDDVGVFE